MSIFAGAAPASAAPVVTIDSPADGDYLPVGAVDYTITGTTSGDTSISLSVTDAGGQTTSYPNCDTTFSGGNGVPWSCDIPGTALSIGANSITVTSDYTLTASDPSTATSNFFVYDTNAAMTIITPGASGTERQPLISGTGPAYGSVSVSACDSPAQPDAAGNWSCTPSSPLSFGLQEISISSLTWGDEASSEDFFDFTVEVPTTNPSYGDGAANVSIDLGPALPDLVPYNFVTPVLPVPGESAGPCSDPICSFELDPGVALIETAYQTTDGSEMSGPFRRDYWRTPDAPTLDTPVANGDGSWTFSGTGVTDGDLVRVRDDVNYRCQGIIAGGEWSCTIPSSPVGAVNYVAITQSQGFDAAAAGIVDPEMGASYNGYSATSQTESITTPTSFSSEAFSGYRGDLVTVSGTKAADDPNFRVMFDREGTYSEACVPALTPGDTSFSCDIDTTLSPDEVTTLVAGTWAGEGFETKTVGTAELRILRATTLGHVGDSGDFVLSDTVTVGGTTGYNDGSLFVTVGSAGCEAPVSQGVWSCALSMLRTDSTATITVARGPDASWPALAAQDVHIVAPPVVWQDDSGVIITADSSPVINGTGEPFDGEFSTTVTVDVSGNGITPFTCTTTTAGISGEGSEGDPSGYYECDLGQLQNGTYQLSVRQSPQWADPRVSQAVQVTLIVQSSVNAIECSFAPGGITVSGTNVSIGLYEVGTLGEGWNPENLGLCSGSAGTPALSRTSTVGSAPAVKEAAAPSRARPRSAAWRATSSPACGTSTTAFPRARDPSSTTGSSRSPRLH